MLTPANGATFIAPARIVLVANVSNTGRQVRRVEFFSGSTRLGTGMPFSQKEVDDDEGDHQSGSNLFMFVWNRVPARSYTLKAKVTYSGGSTATSASVNITVKRATVAPRRTSR
jgi:hypothetical protein